MDYKIYSLKNDNTNSIFYIGCTTSKLSNRLSQHKWDAKNKYSKKAVYIKNLLDNNIQISIDEIESCNINNWQERERYWIYYYNINNLQNSVIGGTGIILDRTQDSINKSSNHKFKKIKQFTLSGEYINTYDSIVEASKSLNVVISSITNALNGMSKTCQNSLWIYDNQPNPESYTRSAHPNKLYFQTVIQYDKLNNVINKFNSLIEASIQTSISIRDIRNCCTNRQKSTKGYIFKFGD